ncbi:MAG: TonB-dependent receptor [Gammaproteobacteria bacterium]|nr:TonB-dependent receptor [Gammaproteobacteria bacterium]
MIGQLSQRLTLQWGFGWLDATFKEGPILNAQDQSWDLSGNQLIAAPAYNTFLAADYRVPVGAGSINSHIDINYQDDQWFSAFNDKAGYENIGQPGYALANARIEYESNKSYSVALWVRNLADKQYKVYAINLSEAFGYNYNMYRTPRTFGVEFNLRF